MLIKNHEYITKGFNLVVSTIAPYIARELGFIYQDRWWQKGVWDKLYNEQKRDLPYG